MNDANSTCISRGVLGGPTVKQLLTAIMTPMQELAQIMNITISWYFVAFSTLAPARIWPVSVPGMLTMPMMAIELIPGSRPSLMASTATGLAASHLLAPKARCLQV